MGTQRLTGPVRGAGLVLSMMAAIAGLAVSAWAGPPQVVTGTPAKGGNLGLPGEPTQFSLPVDLVFVSRQIPSQGSIFWIVPKDMPGVGPYSRVRPAAPGKLMVRKRDGTLRTLIDGSNPTAASLNLIDVNAPAVSYDGTKIVFAGLPAGTYDSLPNRTVGGWRLYVINVNGTGLGQLTFSDQTLDYSRFGAASTVLQKYDDFDPVWLPDGRVCFASTRYPSLSHYKEARTSNLYTVNIDGTNVHRITAERNGADRPSVDPLTGRIVYARWWRNYRFAVDSMDTIEHGAAPPAGGFDQHLGLTKNRDVHVGGANNLFTNHWQPTSINTDGSDLKLFAGFMRDHVANATYGGAFAPDGTYFANFFPSFNMTDAAGFGGVRKYTRGPGMYTPVAGITEQTLDYVSTTPLSFGIYRGEYVGEPEVLPDGRLIVSRAPDHFQDYGLYVMKADGTDRQLVLDFAGTTELRARAIVRRPLPPIPPDIYRDDLLAFPAAIPPTAAGPFDSDGVFTFNSLNVYFNAPVDTDIISAPPVGSANSIRFFIDHQRTGHVSFGNLDWPILLKEKTVNPDGSVFINDAPANLPLFEQLRSAAPEYKVPLTGGPNPTGAAHVTGMNFAPSGAEARCVGCHAGHTLMTVPDDDDQAKFTNVAPGATLTVSSERSALTTYGLVDRRVMKGAIDSYWNSDPAQAQDGQWVRLTFRVPVTVKTVRLYNPRFGDTVSSSIQVEATTVRLYSDEAATVQVGEATTGPITVAGTDVPFEFIKARVVEVRLDDVSGTFDGLELAALAEVEVIARGEAAE